MGVNNQYNEYLMQSDGNNYIAAEIKNVLLELDSNRILSRDDRLELKDHFLNEVENLNDLGLNDQEALLIAKKRFGVLEDVQTEYQKVKPNFDLVRYGIIGVVAFCMINIFAISIDLFSKIFWLFTYEISDIFALLYYSFDIPFRIFLIFVFGFFANKMITKVNFINLASLWKFPIIYFLFEFVNRCFYFILPGSGFSSELLWHMSLNSNAYLLNYILAIFIMIFASYKMYKMKVLDMDYV
jgi:hypothetical protein